MIVMFSVINFMVSVNFVLEDSSMKFGYVYDKFIVDVIYSIGLCVGKWLVIRLNSGDMISMVNFVMYVVRNVVIGGMCNEWIRYVGM